MNTNKSKRFDIRISAENKLLLEYYALKNKTTVSRVLNSIIEKLILDDKIKIRRGELNYEDVQTYIDNKLQQRKVLAGKNIRVY